MASPVQSASIEVGLSTEELSIDSCLKVVRRNSCGAVVFFLGTVRDLTGEQVTQRLDYFAYEAMAEKELHRICQEACLRWSLGGVVVKHRTGTLQPGETAVVVAVSSTHRQAAFEAARFLIDETKLRVPLWKKEYGPDGTAWIEGDARVSSS